MPITRTPAFAATDSTAESMDNEGGGQLLTRWREERATKAETPEESGLLTDDQPAETLGPAEEESENRARQEKEKMA